MSAHDDQVDFVLRCIIGDFADGAPDNHSPLDRACRDSRNLEGIQLLLAGLRQFRT